MKIKNKKTVLKYCSLILIVSMLPMTIYCIMNLNFTKDKSRPAYILEEKIYNNFEEASKAIKDLPFIVLQNIVSGYKISEIVYTKDRDNSCKVSFNYLSKNNDTIQIEYISIGDNIEMYIPIMSVSPNIIRIETNLGMNDSQDKILPINKFIKINLPRYQINITVSDSGVSDATDKTKDEILLEIAKGYLQSDLINIKSENDIIFNTQTFQYNSFEELQKGLPDNITIIEPKYIPDGFQLKYISGKYFIENPAQCFNFTATYEDLGGKLLSLSYKTRGESGVHENNNNKMEQNNVYRIQCDKNSKGYLVPYIEKYLPTIQNKYDLHIYLQYKVDETIHAEDYEEELRRVLEGVKE